MHAASTATIVQLNTQWSTLVDSARLRRAIATWNRRAPSIPDVPAAELVELAANRSPGERTCSVLDALITLAYEDELALRTVIQAMLPRWVSIVQAINHPTVGRDEVAALVVAIGTEVLLDCRSRPSTVPTDYRVWSKTRQRTRRHLDRWHPAAEAVTDPEEFQRIMAVGSDEQTTGRSLDELAEWVAHTARVSPAAARVVVGTRTGAVTLAEAATATGSTYAAVAKRRARAEASLRRTLMAGV